MIMVDYSDDRAAGVLLGQACGDALGVPHEFGPALPESFVPQMVGGGPFGFAPGEYSDDTSMAVCIGEVAATGADLTAADSIDTIAGSFLAWARTSKDVGNQTRAVFSAAQSPAQPSGASGGSGSTGERVWAASHAYASAHPGRAGNGALMRTSIVALSRPGDRDATAAAARTVAAITHADPLAVESCVLWSEAIRLAVATGERDLLAGLDLLDANRREQWRSWIDEATNADPRTFNPNGFTVHALQAAWAAITWTAVPALDPAAGTHPAQHFELALMNAVRAGNDTDTVAAIAGGLLGALWGWSAIPSRWSRAVHGYGGHRARGLVTMALLTAQQGRVSPGAWPRAERMTAAAYVGAPTTSAVHPHDDGVVLGTVNSSADFGSTAHGCDAVVSLCRIGAADIPAPGVADGDHVEIRLVDSDRPDDNAHLDLVLADAAAVIRQLRDEGRRVFVHCVAAEQRTPSVAVAYSRLLGIPADQAQTDVRRALPGLRGHGLLWDAAVAVRSGSLRASHP